MFTEKEQKLKANSINGKGQHQFQTPWNKEYHRRKNMREHRTNFGNIQTDVNTSQTQNQRTKDGPNKPRERKKECTKI